MTGLHEFIIEIKIPLNDTFKTETGVELYGNEKFSVDRLANRIGTVINTPLFHDTDIEPGDEVMIEPTIFHKQIYRSVEQDYTRLVDKNKMWFRVTPAMIVLYKKNGSDEWKGYLKNNLVELVKKNAPKITSTLLYLPEEKEEYEQNRVRLLYGNEELQNMGAENGDNLVINPIGGLDFWIDGKRHWWVRNIDIWAVES